MIKKNLVVCFDTDTVSYTHLATGLAYTTVGGDIILIESTYYKGKGSIILTGNLGDVMQESAKAAISYVHSKSKELGIDDNIFAKSDMHIHVPSGAKMCIRDRR